jgi:hypothetical protein
MIVYGNGKVFFSVFLSDDVLVEIFFYLFWCGHFVGAYCRFVQLFSVLLDYVMTQIDAFGADEYSVGSFD